MDHLPNKYLTQAISEMAQLPGIGKRTAMRLVLHLLRKPKNMVTDLAEAIAQLNEIQYCQKCHNISNKNICDICENPNRIATQICVVEDIRDVLAIENTLQYKGLYHVLNGVISPMEGIGPSQLTIESLVERIDKEPIAEVIFALSATMEGDTTSYYIYKLLQKKNVQISIIARGIGIGESIEYIDEITLGRSLMNRVQYENSLKLN